MGVIFEKVGNAASRMREDAEYIARQDPSDVFDDARQNIIEAVDILMRSGHLRVLGFK